MTAPSHVRFAQLCQASYDDATRAFLERGNVKVTRTEEAGAWVYYAARGTRIDHPSNVARDLDCRPKHYDGVGTLHAGFGDGALSVLELLAEAVAKEALPVWFGGHSLGAAIGLSAAAMLLARGLKLAGAVTFGCPRPVFWAPPLRGLPGPDYRRALDPVMEVPIGFSHFRPPPFDLGRIILGDILDPLHDHFIEGYIAALQIAGIP